MVKPTTTTHPLVLIALGTALVLATYVTPMVTMPSTVADLTVGAEARAWILSSMSVGLAAGLLASGVLGDALGHRRVYLCGLLLLSAGSMLAAVAWGPWVLVAARVAEGVGGAAMLACGLAIIAHTYPPGPARTHATSIWGASVGSGIAAGSLLAAALDVGSGWRENYAATGLLAILLVAPTMRRVPESRSRVRRRVDGVGLILLALTMVLLVAALTQARTGMGALVVMLAVAAFVCFIGLGLVERYVARPLLDPELLFHPRSLAATLGAMTMGLGMIGMASFAPTIAQSGFGDSMQMASVPPFVWALSSAVAAVGVRRLPQPLEGPLPIAALLVLLACGLLTAYWANSTWDLMIPMVLSGVVTGLLNAVLGREAVASVPADHAAMGSGANSTARYLGAACGITLFVVVATHAGASLVVGWRDAVLVATLITLTGAVLVSVQALRRA